MKLLTVRCINTVAKAEARQSEVETQSAFYQSRCKNEEDRIRPVSAESFSSDAALRAPLTAVNTKMLLQVVLVLEGFSTLAAFELAVSSSFSKQWWLQREKQI